MRFRKRFPYRVVVQDGARKLARTFRAYSPRHAMSLAHIAMREDHWQNDWQTITQNGEAQS